MSINLVFKNGKSFRIYENLSYTNSNTEVTFQELVLDFTGHTLLDIPYKYQECSVIRTENGSETILFTGFVDEVSFADMQMSEENRELHLVLLSPMAMSTVRTTTLVGTYEKRSAIITALQPLIDDGFILNALDIPSGQITCNYLLETIEFVMNELSYKLGLFWHIDENKNIVVKQIDNMFIEDPKVSIRGKVQHCLRLQPSVENVEYANVINIKKARMYYFAQSRRELGEDLQFYYVNYQYPIIELPVTLKKGDTVTFANPFVMNSERLNTLADEKLSEFWGQEDSFYNFYIETDNYLHNFYDGIIVNPETREKEIQSSGNWTKDQENNSAELTLVTDSFFKNLIVGLRYNGETTLTIHNIFSNNALRYVNLKFMNNEEIIKLRGIISDTGIVEKTIDYNDKWSTQEELIDYASSLLTKNTNTINQIEAEFDIDLGLKVGDIVRINKPKFYINGKFVVTDITYTYNSDLEENWAITFRNADLLSSFIDLFRPTTSQETAETTDSIMIAEYTAEGINEIHTEGVS